MKTKISKARLEQTLKDVLNLAGLHMNTIAQEMNNIKITAESSEQDKHSWTIFHSLRVVINNIIHPAHQLSLTLFPENKKFIDQAILQHKKAREDKLLKEECICQSCKLNKGDA